MKICLPLTALLSVLSLSACTPPETPPSPFKPTASIQEIMTSIIDPSIDYVWNSVSTVTTKNGTEERKPITDEDWKIVRQHALTVIEASNLLIIDGRRVAPADVNTSSGGAELGSDQIQVLVDSQHAEFVKRAQEFHDAAFGFLAAIDAKNVEELENAGGRVEHACEQCHSQFWYPNDTKPQ